MADAADLDDGSGDRDDGEPIPLAALQHAVYCLRQAALIHLERLWADNRFTAEGQVLHVPVDNPMGRSQRGVRRVTALPIACRRLGFAGVADLVEFAAGPDGETAYPVEFKGGRPSSTAPTRSSSARKGSCLEEMTGRCRRARAATPRPSAARRCRSMPTCAP